MAKCTGTGDAIDLNSAIYGRSPNRISLDLGQMRIGDRTLPLFVNR